MAAWFVDVGLAMLIRMWRLLHPNAIVGTIGDEAHTYGEHIPEADGSVDAADFMKGNGVTDAMLSWLANTLATYRDKRLLYIIWQQRIFSNNNGASAWAWRSYSGDYHDHVHVSVNDNYESDNSPWNLGESDMDLSDQLFNGNPTDSWKNRYGTAVPTVQNAMAFAAYDAHDAEKAINAVGVKLDKIIELLSAKK